MVKTFKTLLAVALVAHALAFCLPRVFLLQLELMNYVPTTNLQVYCLRLARNLSLSSFRAVANLSDELLLLLSAAFCINEQRGCVGCKVNITLKDNRYLFSILLPRIHRFKTLRI